MAVFILDTRNQKDDFVEKALKDLGHDIVRSKLPFGDVAVSTDILNVVDLKSSGGGLIELAHNVCSKDHDRLRKEIIKCLEVKGNITFMVFEPHIHRLEDVPFWKVPTFKSNVWTKVYYLNGKRVPKKDLEKGKAYNVEYKCVHRKGDPRTSIKPEILYKALKTMSEPNHYGKGTKINFIFTDKKNCGKRIEELLLTTDKSCDTL